MTTRILIAVGVAALLNCSSANSMEFELVPRCAWPSPIPLPLCLLQEPEVVNCQAHPEDALCEDFPGALKVVTAKTRRMATCKSEFQVTFRDLAGSRQNSLRTRAIDCATLEPITAP